MGETPGNSRKKTPPNFFVKKKLLINSLKVNTEKNVRTDGRISVQTHWRILIGVQEGILERTAGEILRGIPQQILDFET